MDFLEGELLFVQFRLGKVTGVLPSGSITVVFIATLGFAIVATIC